MFTEQFDSKSEKLAALHSCLYLNHVYKRKLKKNHMLLATTLDFSTFHIIFHKGNLLGNNYD